MDVGRWGALLLGGILSIEHSRPGGMGALASRAPDVAPVIDRPNWCVHGTPTRTTGEEVLTQKLRVCRC
jgi:hypothetical protein